MPAIYTHYYFGQEIIEKLPLELQDIIRKHPREYDFGTQGPDFFFYDRPFSKENLSSYGSTYHCLPGYTFFKKAKEELAKYQDKEPLLAYIFGFLSHYVLDSLMHTYISNCGLSHAAIEAEYDSHLLRKDGIDPLHYNRSRIIKTTPLISDFIAKVFDIDLKSVRSMLNSFRYLSFAIDLPPTLVHFIMKKVGVYESFGQLTLTKNTDPQYDDSNRILDRIYQSAKELYQKMALKLMNFLQDKEELDQDFDYNYENRR